MIRRNLLITILALSPFYACATQLEYQQQLITHAGPMSVYGLTNDWQGKFRNDDNGFLWHQVSSGFSIGSFSLAYISRFHGQYQIPSAIAKGFYYESNNIVLEEEYSAPADIKVKDYRGYGWQAGWTFRLADTLTLKPTITWLVLNRLIWGKMDGNLHYQQPGEWGGRIHIDYGYTEDKVFRRRLKDNYYGDLYGLGLQLNWQYQNYSLKYNGENLAGKIAWPGQPYSNGVFDTDGVYLLDITENFVDRNMKLPAVHWLHQQLTIGSHYDIMVDLFHNDLETTFNAGMGWHNQALQTALTYNPQWKSMSFHIQHQYAGFELSTGSLNLKESRTLGAALRLTFAF